MRQTETLQRFFKGSSRFLIKPLTDRVPSAPKRLTFDCICLFLMYRKTALAIVFSQPLSGLTQVQ